MSKSIVMLSELNKIIARYKDNEHQKGALLVLKGQCKPRLKEGIPKQVAVAVITQATTGEAALANVFAEREDDDMFFYHDERRKHLDNVIEIVYADDDEE